MSSFMTATQARALYDRAQRPRQRRVDHELNAALAAMLADEIRVARKSAAIMAVQGHNGSAAYVFAEVRRMTELAKFYGEGDDV